MIAKFNPVDTFYKSAVGGASRNKKIVFTIISNAETCYLQIRPDNGEYANLRAKKAGNRFVAEYLPRQTGLFFYRFVLNGEQFGMPNGGYSSAQFGTLKEGGEEFQLTVFSEDFITPDWIKGGVIYQIFPDRFKRIGNTLPRQNQVLRDWGGQPEFLPVNGKVLNNDFFGGTIKGITSSLPYLNKLGITALYLNPIFEARSNHRYDTGDYMSIDGLLGTEDDLKELFDTAKSYGIGIILDGVFNHTGDDSLYFNKYKTYQSLGAYNSKNSEYYGWYNFRSFPNDYECWWGIETLPQVNENDNSFTEFICRKNGVLGHYSVLGANGWRLDVVDELPSEFVKKIRKAIKTQNPDAVIIGEVWENVTDKISYGVRREYFCGNELDSAMNYPLKDAIINFILSENSSRLIGVLRRQIDCYPAVALNCLMNILGTHDTPRILNILSGAEMPGSKEEQAENKLTEEQLYRGINALKIASAIEYTVYGVPAVYYGDERGMTGWGDPFNRGCMEWESFSPLTDWYTKLGEIRRKSKVFATGELKIIRAEKRFILYTREFKDDIIYIAVNLGPQTPVLNFSEQAIDLLSGEISKSFAVPYQTVRIITEEK